MTHDTSPHTWTMAQDRSVQRREKEGGSKATGTEGVFMIYLIHRTNSKV